MLEYRRQSIDILFIGPSLETNDSLVWIICGLRCVREENT